MAKNAVLKRKAKRAMRQARKLSRRSGKTEHLYREANYAAKRGRKNAASSSKPRSCRPPAKNPRTIRASSSPNLKQSPQWIYEKVYCQRGEIENRIKGAPAKPARSRW